MPNQVNEEYYHDPLITISKTQSLTNNMYHLAAFLEATLHMVMEIARL